MPFDIDELADVADEALALATEIQEALKPDAAGRRKVTRAEWRGIRRKVVKLFVAVVIEAMD